MTNLRDGPKERGIFGWTRYERLFIKFTFFNERSSSQTGREIPIRTDIASFPASLSSMVDAGHLDVLAPGKFVVGADVKAYLQTQRSPNQSTSALSVHRAATTGLDDYISRNQQRVPFERGVEFRKYDRDANKRAFVAAINAQIRLIIARRVLGYSDSQRRGPRWSCSGITSS